MEITDKDRLDFIEKFINRISWYPYTSSHKEGIQRRFYLNFTNNTGEYYQADTIREAIDNAIIAMMGWDV